MRTGLAVLIGLIAAISGIALLVWLLWRLWIGDQESAAPEPIEIEVPQVPPAKGAEAPAAPEEGPEKEAVAPTEVEVSPEAAEVAPQAAEADDLKVIEGIGPKISMVLQEGGIQTFAQLAGTEPEEIRAILEAADPRLARLADPGTWPEQAALAAGDKWQALADLQDTLKGGRKA
jgi:predicted flap endonuclease-1-like 5' DNA nuclease